MKVNISGQFSGFSGYAVHTRNLTLALDKMKNVDVSFNGGITKEDSLKYRHLVENNYSRENNIMITLPDQWRYFFPEKHDKLIGYLVYEGTELPLNWTRNCNNENMDEIIVPSKHVKESALNSGVDKEIKIIPHGHDPTVFNTKLEKIWDDDTFRFLFVGGWKDGVKDRKGLDIAFKAFKEEFKDEDVKFMASVNTTYGGMIKRNIESLNLPKGKPEIEVLTNIIPQEELAKLYYSCDVFVGPSKAEGFGLSFLESLACGTPCIAGGFGGQTDFVTEKNGWLIDYDLKPATGGFLYENSQWGIPRQSHLQKLMRESYENRKMREKKMLNGLKTAKKMTWDHTAKKITRFLPQ